jgi:hypothetical protein
MFLIGEQINGIVFKVLEMATKSLESTEENSLRVYLRGVNLVNLVEMYLSGEFSQLRELIPVILDETQLSSEKDQN